MNKRSLSVISTKEDLFLLGFPVLEYLHALGYRLIFRSEGMSKECFARLPGVEVSEYLPEENETCLYLTDRLEIPARWDRARTFIFPILNAELVEAYQNWQTKQAQKIPLAPQPFWGKRIGDAPSLHDFIERQIQKPVLKGRCVLISAGPTIEDIDPVRFLSNRSSGKMGLALARVAFRMGADVQLVCGPVALTMPVYLDVRQVRSTADMAEAVLELFPSCDIYVGSAAVADFTPAAFHAHKIKKGARSLSLQLQSTIDILQELGRCKEHQMLVGFSLETENEIEHSRKKLVQKNLDMIVVNNPLEKGAAFAGDTNRVTVIMPEKVESWPLLSKEEVAQRIYLKLIAMEATNAKR